MIKKIMLLFLLFMNARASTHSDWTWIYRKNFNEAVRATHAQKKTLLYAHDNMSPFTQLIFSWNAVRPEEGYFSFYVQVRDAATKRWGTWHHMVDWGKSMQHSYISKSDGFSSYMHVRLETDDKKAADALKIKIESHQSAPLSLMHGFCVAFSDFTLFKPERYNSVDGSLPSVHVPDIPVIAQFALDHDDKGRICSPVSCCMVVQHLTGCHKNPLNFATGVFDSGLGVYGSWGCNVAHAFEHVVGKAYCFVRRMNGFADLHYQLAQGMPVVVSVRGTLPGALKSFPHGHLMVVVGWDNSTRELLCHDPAAESHEMVFKRYPLEHFLRAWECSHRLAYVAERI